MVDVLLEIGPHGPGIHAEEVLVVLEGGRRDP